MQKFSIRYGAIPEQRFTMKMKNEYMYPSLILFDIKKTYAGIVAIQEGQILDKPKPDIKGVALRGSDVAPEAIAFTKNLIVNDILHASAHGKISANALIEKVAAFERKIYHSLQKGETDFLKITSINLEEDYADPLRCAFFYYMAWDEIFSTKYGAYLPPIKTVVIPLIRDRSGYYAWLDSKYPDINRKWMAFEKQYKALNFIALNPMLEKIPEEIIPAICMRDVIYHTMKSVYVTMDKMQLGIGYKNQKLLYNDIVASDLMIP